MPVFRVDKSRDFTVVPNCVFKDRSLSAKAKGILVEMLSLHESWDYTLKGLTTLFSDEIDSIRQGINELEKHGYIVRERKRDSRGRLGGMEYVIYETPHIVREEDQTSQSVENFAPESPEPTTENPTQDSSAREEIKLQIEYDVMVQRCQPRQQHLLFRKNNIKQNLRIEGSLKHHFLFTETAILCLINQSKGSFT